MKHKIYVPNMKAEKQVVFEKALSYRLVYTGTS